MAGLEWRAEEGTLMFRHNTPCASSPLLRWVSAWKGAGEGERREEGGGRREEGGGRREEDRGDRICCCTGGVDWHSVMAAAAAAVKE